MVRLCLPTVPGWRPTATHRGHQFAADADAATATVALPAPRRPAHGRTRSHPGTHRRHRRCRDRLAAQLVVAVADIDGLHPELFADLSPQVWLEQTCRMTSTEARTLLATADTLPICPPSSPDSRTAGCRGPRPASWPPPHGPSPWHAGPNSTTSSPPCWTSTAGYGPDELTGRIWHTVETWQPDRRRKAEAAAERDEFLALRPTLFGGGSMYGEFGPASFATLAEALDAPLGPPVAADLDDPDAVEQALDELDDRARAWPAPTANAPHAASSTCAKPRWPGSRPTGP
jgi:hypothetical protein